MADSLIIQTRGLRKEYGSTVALQGLDIEIEAGGIVGILAGAGGAVALAKLQGWATVVSPQAVVVAFVFSAVIGIFFGLWPARRASLLDPIEALRHE